jgi:hypothetical protein
MAKPNDAFANRQRDLVRKRKKEEQRSSKAGAQAGGREARPLSPPGDDGPVA